MRTPLRGPWTLLLAVLLVAVALAGCTTPGDGDGTYTVTITQAPAQADLGEEITIRWRIEGPDGSTDHTGVHYGLTSTSGMESFTTSDYDAASPHRTGSVPGTFETTFNISFPGTIHWRGHLIVDGQHYWSTEQTIQVEGTPNEVLDFPDQVEAGSSFDVTWRVHHLRPTQIPHTAIHFDNASHDQPYRGGDPFQWDLGLRPQPAHSGEVPATFQATIPANAPGTLYFVAHAVIDGVNWLSDEHSVQVVNPSTPNIVILDAPDSVAEGEAFNVTFQVNHPMDNTVVDHVGLEWDDTSHGADVGAYQEGPHKGTAELPVTVPNRFTLQMTAPDADDVDVLYMRAHARTLANDTDILSVEFTVDVLPTTAITVTDAPDCVEAEQQGQGDATVEVTFEVTVPTEQTSTHIGIHYDDQSHAGDDATSGDYADSGPHAGGDLPGTFARNFTVSETGTYYYRAHALLADGTSLLSDEQSVDVQVACLGY